MYLKNSEKHTCSGCTACMNICKQNAIIMKEDEEGFKYPYINKELCIKCGACYNICPNIKHNKENYIIEAYGVKHKNEEERSTSRSGGVFVAISDYILNKNGVIYGAELKDDFTVCHNRATNKEERDKFKGSKYIQSDMKDIIQKVKQDLKDGKKVLFSGTPCQIAGVKSAIPIVHRENLYTCDIVCHGVPSEKVFKDYLKYMEKVTKSKIQKVNFRDKRFGWSSHYETMTFEDGTEKTTEYFKNLFYRHNILRPSCHNCNYANAHRPADITIADFWGIDEINPEFYDEKGVSLVIINNLKGKEIFENIKEELEVMECTIEDCLKYTYTLNQPTPKSENREKFWEDYFKKDFNYIIEKYAK